jgi:hypothetical protein
VKQSRSSVMARNKRTSRRVPFVLITIAACFAAFSAYAQAGVQKWTIDIRGLEVVGCGWWSSCEGRTGRKENGTGFFIGSDVNGDGEISTAEVSTFKLLWASNWWTNDDLSPTLPDIHYSKSEGLKATFEGYRTSLVFGDYFAYLSPMGSDYYYWQPTTVTTILGPFPVAVPEPETASLLMAGVVLLAMRIRRGC